MPTTLTLPDYGGGSLVNLVAELEHRLTGRSVAPPLRGDLSMLIPEADTYVVLLFDGLGLAQLGHPAAATLARSVVATVDAPFPTTTTVSLASIATGLFPAAHGLIAYQLWLPEVDQVVNTIHWRTLWGDPVPGIDLERFLPSPNLWERLTAAGVEAITIQPSGFEASNLTKVLYRGARFEAATTTSDLVTATAQLASRPRRLILSYLPHVDFAAHVHGQQSKEYAAAVRTADDVWSSLRAKLPAGAMLVGTADHGHIDVPREMRYEIPKAEHAGRILYGDSRAMFVRGAAEGLAEGAPAAWIDAADMAEWWGPGALHDRFAGRVPDGTLLSADGTTLLHRYSDRRLLGTHGGLMKEEREVPLLVAPAPAAGGAE